MVTIEGNGIVKIIFVSKYLNGNIRWPQMVINYNFMEGVTYEEKELIFSSELDIFSIGMNILPNQEVTEP
jgi:hypothetical protein